MPTSIAFTTAYDCIRMQFQAKLVSDGLLAYSHEAIIDYAQHIGMINEETAQTLHDIRQKRNDIEYRGATATSEETEQILRLAAELLLR